MLSFASPQSNVHVDVSVTRAFTATNSRPAIDSLLARSEAAKRNSPTLAGVAGDYYPVICTEYGRFGASADRFLCDIATRSAQRKVQRGMLAARQVPNNIQRQLCLGRSRLSTAVAKTMAAQIIQLSAARPVARGSMAIGVGRVPLPVGLDGGRLNPLGDCLIITGFASTGVSRQNLTAYMDS